MEWQIDFLDNRRIGLGGVERRVRKEVRLDAVGGSFYREFPPYERKLPDYLELCLRFGSDRETMPQELGGRRYEVRFPHAVIKEPGQTTTHFHGSSNHRAIYLIFSRESLMFFRQSGLLAEPLVWEFELDGEIRSLLGQIQELIRRSQLPSAADSLDALVLALWIALDGRKKRDSMPEVDPLEPQLRRAASYLQLNFAADIDYAELAAAHGMSRRTFFRHWWRIFRDTPHRFVLELKLQAAARMLGDGADSIESIARQLNFRQSNYFCGVFRRRYGLTPLQYRRQHFGGQGG